MNGNVQHLNPAGLHKNPAYSQAVVISGLFVTALAHPDFLVEIDAIAVVPQQ